MPLPQQLLLHKAQSEGVSMIKKMPVAVLICLCAILSIAFAGDAAPAKNTKVLKSDDGVFNFEEIPYTLGPDDVVEIDVQGHPEFSGQYNVTPEGIIQYQYLGDIQVEGLTKNELQEKLTSLLTEYLNEPKVVVRMVQYRSKYVYVMGEVGRPGKYPLNGPSITVRDALIMAGLPNNRAGLRGSYIIRPDGDTIYKKKIDLCKLLLEGDLSNNYILRPGDIIYVPMLTFAKVGTVLDHVLGPAYKAAVVEDLTDGD